MTTVPRLIQKLNESGLALLIARLVVGVALILYSIDKIEHPSNFLKLIREYEIIPQAWYVLLNLTAVVLPWIEMIGGLALILGVALRGTGSVIFVMMIVFTMAIVLRTIDILQTEGTAFFHIKFDCGCGLGETTIWIKLIENTGLILLSLLVFLSRSRRYCLSALFCKNP